MSLSIYFLYTFTASFLKVKEVSGLLNKVMIILRNIALLFLIPSCFDYPVQLIAVQGLSLLCVITAVIILLASILAIIKKNTAAYYFIIAFLFIAPGVIFYILRDIGLIPQTLFAMNAIYIGLVIQSLILSFAVLDRFRRITREGNEQLEKQKDEIQLQKNKLEENNKELKKLSTVASKTDNTIAIFDNKGEMIWVNEGFEKLYGFTYDEYIEERGKNIADQSTYPGIKKLLSECYENKKSVNYQSVLLNKYGEEVWVQTTLTPITDNKGDIEFLIAIESNITVLKKFESDLIVARDKAKESDKLKSAFLSNMSHEIRTPMNAIVGFSNILNDADLEEEDRQKFVSLINSNCNVLLQLIADIIDISKIEAGELKIYEKTFNLNQQLTTYKDLFMNVKNSMDKDNVILELLKPDSGILKITTDEVKLQQIFTNLVHNALKFTEQGYVKFGYNLFEDKKIVFFVKDSGKGIPSDKFEIIFDRFRKLDEDKKKLYGGTGLGLAITKSLVELLGGKIWVDSESDKGASFYFTINCVISEHHEEINYAESEIDKSKVIQSYDWHDKTILIAEDEESNYLLLKEIFHRTGVNIIWSRNGKQTIEICKSQGMHVDLILMDIKMPEMNGYEATKKIKEMNRDLPIIALTAYALEDEMEKSLKAGCDDYISKPFEKGNLMKKINYFLEGK